MKRSIPALVLSLAALTPAALSCAGCSRSAAGATPARGEARVVAKAVEVVTGELRALRYE